MRREGLKGRLMAGWLPPTLVYIVVLGAGGVTAKLALRTITWEQMVLWLPIAYIFFSILLIAFRGASFPVGVGSAWAGVTAFAASSALILFFYALTKGPASQVTPATSAYPIVTVIGSALFLGEKITLIRGIGTGLVILGVVLLSR
jgi:drug/metabolite transporter (DMT)-like permease